MHVSCNSKLRRDKVCDYIFETELGIAFDYHRNSCVSRASQNVSEITCVAILGSWNMLGNHACIVLLGT